MKKTAHTIAIAAALAAAAAGLVSCKAPETEQEKVYGPPPDIEIGTSAEEEPSSLETSETGEKQ